MLRLLNASGFTWLTKKFLRQSYLMKCDKYIGEVLTAQKMLAVSPIRKKIAKQLSLNSNKIAPFPFWAPVK